MDDIPLSLLFTALGILLVFSAFFSGSETALMSINRYRLIHLAREGSRGARLAQKLLEQPERLIGLILLGNNFVNISASAIATIASVRIGGEAGVVVGTAVLTVVVLIFSEVAPKTLAALNPERVALPASYILWPMLRVSLPVVWAVNRLVAGVLWLAGHREPPGDAHALSAPELRTLLQEGGRMIPEKHRQMLLNILALEEAKVEDIMVPRNEIEGIDLEADAAELRELLATFPFSRAPVYRGSIDQVVGILHLRNLLCAAPEVLIDHAFIEARVRKPYFVPEGTPLTKQMLEFQRMKRRVGLVVDEYGDIVGLVTLPDILEEIVGDFVSAPGQNTRRIQHNADGSLLIDGRTPLHNINRHLGWDLPTDEFSTLNGLIVGRLEALPVTGAEVEIEGLRMRIEAIGDNVVRQVRVLTPTEPVQD
ncbi:HlyC/CorC family transporter [Aquimonas sp.]|jgi:Mg2+/Co2+ transporter CorB|uniref:HlyC/CorC family transporter n=1 Tax=Aquimonas sp. TaxID=1872588 RepID=UPI0037C0E9AD